jgi:hypothetical protein
MAEKKRKKFHIAPTPTAPFQVRMPQPLLDRLKRYCIKHNETMTDAVLRAVRKLVGA